MNNNGYVQILFSALFLVQGSFADLKDPLPNNMAVSRGATDVVMSCASTRGNDVIGWSYFRVGSSSEELIAYGSKVEASYAETYTVTPIGNETSNLVIKRITESVAGTYICREGPTAKTASAQLIFINSDPMCTNNLAGATEIKYGQVVGMSSSISYYGTNSSVSAKVVWSPDASAMPLNMTTTGNMTTATSTITPSAGYVKYFPDYSCTTSFQITPSSGMDNRAPTYNYTCRPFNSTISVNYIKPDSITINVVTDTDVPEGTTITCNVEANPPANYTWLDADKKNINNASIRVWNSGEYICTAWNKAGNVSKAINLTTYTTTAAPTTTTTPTTTMTSVTSGLMSDVTDVPTSTPIGGMSQKQKNDIIIGVCVGVGGAILIAVVAGLIYYFVKKQKKDKPRKANSQPSRNNEIPPPYSGSFAGPQRTPNPDVIGVPMTDIPQYSHVQRPNGGRQTHYMVEEDEGLNYAQLAVDNNPRSRLPLQMKDDPNSAYADIQRA